MKEPLQIRNELFLSLKLKPPPRTLCFCKKPGKFNKRFKSQKSLAGANSGADDSRMGKNQDAVRDKALTSLGQPL